MTQTLQPAEKIIAKKINLHSPVSSNITETTALARSLLFAELSMISYLSLDEAEIIATKLGFTNTTLFDHDGSQAYSFSNDVDIVIACRGTEPDEWNDLKADINAVQAVAETVGKVHRGFKKEVDDLWPVLEEMLKDNTKKLWFTGHSLGGAMATICAGRCFLSAISSMPQQIQTFGSPRVGDTRYINHVKVDYLRWVNNNDIVTRSPPVWMGYRHTGTEMYLNSEGKLAQLSMLHRKKDMWKGFIGGLKKKEIDHFSDHSIIRYVKYIYREAKEKGEV